MCSLVFLCLTLRRPKLFSRTPNLMLLFVDPCKQLWTLIYLKIGFVLSYIWKMSEKKCCVPYCKVTRQDDVTLHSFPNPEKDSERFRCWLYNIGGDLLALENQYIYKRRKVCHNHFEQKYHTWTKTLTHNAVPTLLLPGLFCTKKALSDITNTMSMYKEISIPGTSTSTNQLVFDSATTSKTKLTLKKKPGVIKKLSTNLGAIIMKLRKERDSYATRLKKALRLSENPKFQKGLKHFTKLAALFTLMQFREIKKHKMGRRFTEEEKIMALGIYKQGPRAYRWLSKIFILPSPLTLNRLICRVGLKPGINKKIFAQLKERSEIMSQDEKLCILLFDEMAINPHFNYSPKRDLISGFVNNGKEVKRKIADHALVFMVRGILKNYKQPIAYTFCSGTTSKLDLKILIKDVITELQNCGFKVLATLCDQGTTNISAINILVNETMQEYIRKNEEQRHYSFEVNKEEIIPLFDPPHLIKGIRNNLITKHLKCNINGVVKIAKWDHLMQLYEENPAYKGIRLIKNLTELHVNPKKISKMKVKYATQIFSRTVATNMGYLAEKGILPVECKDTADILIFFDDLFDSMNGSFNSSKQKTGKYLLGPVTPKSKHSEVWAKSKRILRTMKFVTKEGREGGVPSINNWLHTLENIEYLKSKLFNEYKLKSIWMRHFNQDPLENFFGCIRSHGCRNVSPSTQGFEAAFTSLLFTKISHYSVGSNCEEDFCKIFDSMNNLLFSNDRENVQREIVIDMEDINCDITDYNVKKKDPRIIAELCYVTGYILKKARINIFKNCSICKANLYCTRSSSEYLSIREYFSFKNCLTYPSEGLIKIFSQVQDIVIHVLENKSEMPDIKNYCKTLILVSVDLKLFKCIKHKSAVTDYIIDLSCRFFLYNWCKDINKTLNGARKERNSKDLMKNLALRYFNRKNKC